MNFRVEYVRPQSGRCLSGEATKLGEAELSRLKGFHLRFAQKNEEWRDWCLRFHSDSTKIIELVCVSPASIERANLLTLYLSDYEERF